MPKSAKKRRRGLAPPPEKLKNALGVAFSFVGAFDVERRGGGVADVLECDAVFAQDVGVAVCPDLVLRGDELFDEGVEFGVFARAWGRFVELGDAFVDEDGLAGAS